MRQLRRIVLALVLMPVVLVLLAAGLLYFPPVQEWAVSKAAEYASRETGMDISVESVRLAFPLDLKVNEVRVLKRISESSENSESVDTVAEIRSAFVDVQLRPLFEGRVMVDALDLNYIKVNTTDLIEAARVKGTLKMLRVASHGIDLKREFVRLDKAKIYGADMDILLVDSVPEDTTSSEIFWKIQADELEVSESRVAVRGKGQNLSADIKRLRGTDGFFDLNKNEYRLARAELEKSAVRYAPMVDLRDVCAVVDSVLYCAPEVSANILQLAFKEQNYGLDVKRLCARVAMDSAAVNVSGCRLETAYSALDFGMKMALDAFDERNPGPLRLALQGSVGKGDVALFREYLPAELLQRLPNAPVKLGVDLSGNLKRLTINRFAAAIPNTISLKADGTIVAVGALTTLTTLGSLETLTTLEALKLNLNASLDCPNIDFLTAFVDPQLLAGTGLRLPRGLPLKASVSLNGGLTNLLVENLSVSVPGHVNLACKGQSINLTHLGSLGNLSLEFDSPSIDFLLDCLDPKMLAGTGIRIPRGIGLKGRAGISGGYYLFDLTATESGGWLKAKGRFNPASERLEADAEAYKLNIDHFLPSAGVGSVTATAAVDYANRRAKGFLDGRNAFLAGRVDIQALLGKNRMSATIGGDMKELDFKRLGMTEAPVSMGMCVHLDLDYDFKDNIALRGIGSDLTIRTPKQTFRPADINLDIISSRDTTHAVIDCGDMFGRLDASGGYERLLAKVGGLADIVSSDIQQRRIDIPRLWAALPLVRLELRAGKENPLSRFIATRFDGVTFDDVNISLRSEPVQGINGNLELYGTNTDALQLDTIRLSLQSSPGQCTYAGQVRNGKQNQQFTFDSRFHGQFLEHGVQAFATLHDAKDRLGVRLGLTAEVADDCLRVTLLDNDAAGEGLVFGYKDFDVNHDNYLMLRKKNRLSADMQMRSKDGMGIGVYTNDDNTDALQDVTLTLARLNLQEILSAIPYAPDVRGILDGDYHYVQDEKSFTVSSSSSVRKLNYAGLDIGNVSSDFVYMPEEDGTHHLDAVVFMDEKEIGSVIGSYNFANGGVIDATLTMHEMPMHLANGFIPNQLFGLRGNGDGKLDIKGPIAKPVINGEIDLMDCHLFSTPYGIDMRFSDDPVRIENSRLLFENFEMFANNDNPLTIRGYLDFADLKDMYMDVRMRADNFGIIDAKENPRSEAYGKAFVDFIGTMKGKVNNLTMRGRLDVLPKTDMAYILRDSPLTTDNQLDELVKFVNTSDTTANLRVERPQLYGFNMDMSVNITSGARVMAYLNADHSNYVDISGDGQLRMTYNPSDELKLTGRYNLAGGQMKYSLPIIPLKTFQIKNGSYVEWTGDVMNPRLNITATETNKAQVDNGTASRNVEFECGVVITKTLSDMGLEFTLDAPEDLEMKSDLATMSKENRGKLAVTMLTTGMYLAEGNTSVFTMNTALSQFLQSEINNITGNALRTLDLSIGMDNITDKDGRMHSDYSFKFAKRFWNNRLKVSIGGKVSTGGSMEHGTETSVFDNVELEYRLDNGGQKYLNLYYDNNSYDWLDGNTQEFGGGFIWKKSAYTLKELLKSVKEPQPSQTPTN